MFNNRLFILLLCLAAVVWALVCYNPFLLWFQNDDFTHLSYSRQGMVFQTNAFRPWCDIHNILQYKIWRINPAGYHFSNLVNHALCAWLVGLLANKIIAQYSPQANIKRMALLAAVLFFIYPLHSESVFWILGEAALLGAFYPLVCLLFLLRENRRGIHTALSLAAYTVSLLTYESGWPLPVIAFILLWHKSKNPLAVKANRYYFLGMGLIFIATLAARIIITHQVIDFYAGQNFAALNIKQLVINYARLIAMGFVANTSTPVLLFACFLLLVMVVVFTYAGRVSTLPVRLVLCFLVSLPPYLSLGIDTHGTEGERYIYLPAVFAVLIIVYAIAGIKAKVLQYAVTMFAVIIYAGKLYINAVNYRFAGSVVRQTVKQLVNTPGNSTVTITGLPKSQYGALIFGKGIDDALAFYKPGHNIHINVLSWRYELDALAMPYKTVIMPALPGAKEVKYVFTDTALVVYK